MNRIMVLTAAGIVAATMMTGGHASADGNAERGSKAFRICAACHSVEKGAHRTGPSLANIWGQKAGMIEGFNRYSDALKNSGIVWDESTLDNWLANPKALVPGNRMVFRGMADSTERQDLIAFLKDIPAGGAHSAGGMQGGMMGQGPLNLKGLGPNNQVKSITHCEDTYDVTTQNGETHQFWEFNLRLKTDSSENGPTKGAPIIIASGMRGDRASVVFAGPDEISPSISRKCK